jgi:hypothetical protein
LNRNRNKAELEKLTAEKEKLSAEARKASTEGVVLEAGEWRKLYDEFKGKYEQLKKDSEKSISDLVGRMNDLSDAMDIHEEMTDELKKQLETERTKHDLEIFALKKKIEKLEELVKNQDGTIDGLRIELIQEKQARQRLEKIVIRFQEWAIRNKEQLERASIETPPSELFNL